MKRSASFYLGLFLIGLLPLAALNCPDVVEDTANALAGTWTVSDATGLPSFTYSGATTITFELGDPVTTGTFTVSGASNLPRLVANDEQVEFPSSGSYTATIGEEDGVLTSIALDGDNDVTLSVTNLDAAGTALSFTYQGAEPKVADAGTVTVTATK
ncbi:MAG TPA: hypothetical protein DCE41_26950 [Cytophagales bacterium]|nr:hypothetical protein [Cytophagales bacterium]HAA22611.1 hypothetical protein [Cytophagales bacterium]HAP63556.1 hypothetical protein [Cytophagales bacterium]